MIHANPIRLEGAGHPMYQLDLDEFLEEVVEAELGKPAILALLRDSERLARRLAEKLKRLAEDLEALRGVREEARPIPRGLGSESCVAIDSTFPPEGGLELVGGQLVGIVAGYLSYKSRVNGVKPRGANGRLVFLPSDEPYSRISVYAKLLEKRLTLRILRLIGEGRIESRVVMLDGEVVPYRLLFGRPRNGLLEKLDELSSRVLEEARRLGVTIIGVVKRSYSRILSVPAGRLLSFNDKLVAAVMLSRGEYLPVGSFNDLLPAYAAMLDEERGGSLTAVVSERLAERPVYGEVRVALYKPSRPTPYGQAVRVEVFNGDVEEVVSVLDRLTNTATGFPLPVDLIDEYVRFEARGLDLVRRKLLGRLAGLAGDAGIVRLLLGHTNPEKRYLYEWRGLRAPRPHRP